MSFGGPDLSARQPFFAFTSAAPPPPTALLRIQRRLLSPMLPPFATDSRHAEAARARNAGASISTEFRRASTLSRQRSKPLIH